MVYRVSFYFSNFTISFGVNTGEIRVSLHNGNLQHAIFDREGNEVSSQMKPCRPLVHRGFGGLSASVHLYLYICLRRCQKLISYSNNTNNSSCLTSV